MIDLTAGLKEADPQPCETPWNSCRLRSLWDMILEFNIETLLYLSREISFR
jgi:hypothetical protein